jgi:hypothetical protein
MTPRIFSRELRELGFVTDPVNKRRFLRRVEASDQYIARDSVRGAAWRLFLGVSPVPSDWPGTYAPNSDIDSWMDAESPWFDYFTDLDPNDPLDAQCDSKEVALQKCFDWFARIGIKWLDDPHSREDDRWRIDYNILVRRHSK